VGTKLLPIRQMTDPLQSAGSEYCLTLPLKKSFALGRYLIRTAIDISFIDLYTISAFSWASFLQGDFKE
jgi:hypothetical protein